MDAGGRMLATASRTGRSAALGGRWRAVLPAVAMAALALGGCGTGLGTLNPQSEPLTPVPTPRLAPETAPSVPLTPVPGLPGSAEDGRVLFVVAGCGGCHTLYGVQGASGVAGPPLTNIVLRPTLAGQTIPLTPEVLTLWLLEPSAIKPGTSMPDVGLTEEQARDITAYLYSLPRNPIP